MSSDLRDCVLDFLSRKFIIAAFFAVIGSVGWLAGKMSGGEFIALVTLITGLYAAADVTQDQLSRRAPPQDGQP